MIIIGYQGIGKTTLARDSWYYVDLDSSCIQINGKKPDGWDEIYVNSAESLSRQGFKVFVSSHKEVRDRLKNSKEPVIICYPSLELKTPWINRLSERFENSRLAKDYRALENAKNYYDSTIIDMSLENFPRIQIEDMKYDLRQLIENIIVRK